MKKQELAALKLSSAAFEALLDMMPATFGTVGIVQDSTARDGACRITDHGERGCVVVLENGELAQRLARALAPKLGATVPVYVVSGTNTGTRFKFKAAAYEATAEGHLRDASGVELDFEDLEQDWGGGDLEARARRVLRDYGALPIQVLREKSLGYRRRTAGKPSSPRVATLLGILKKARAWEAVPQEGGRFELRVELAAGGRQSSFCSAAECEELKKLTGRD